MKRGIVISLKKLLFRTIIILFAVGTAFSVYLIPIPNAEALENISGFSLALAYSNAASSQTGEKKARNSQRSTVDPKGEGTKEEKPETAKAAEDIPKDKRRGVESETLCGTKSDLHYGNVYVRNITKTKTVDIEKTLQKDPDIHIRENDSVQVLIMHTHTTECYMPTDIGAYSTDWPTRSRKESENTVAVGRVIAESLNKAGIKTVQATDVHDDPEYSGAYDRSGETIQKYLKKYPDIQVVLDIHRDAITNSDKSKVKPTVEINGKKAAQIMIINGCEDGSVDNYPDWEINMRFALRLQQQLQADNPNLARPVYFTCREYNQRLTHGSLLIEMGSEANTLEEAKYSAQLLSKSLITVLKSMVSDDTENGKAEKNDKAGE